MKVQRPSGKRVLQTIVQKCDWGTKASVLKVMNWLVEWEDV